MRVYVQRQAMALLAFAAILLALGLTPGGAWGLVSSAHAQQVAAEQPPAAAEATTPAASDGEAPAQAADPAAGDAAKPAEATEPTAQATDASPTDAAVDASAEPVAQPAVAPAAKPATDSAPAEPQTAEEAARMSPLRQAPDSDVSVQSSTSSEGGQQQSAPKAKAESSSTSDRIFKIFKPSPKKEVDHFQLDFDPSQPAAGAGKTPIYKHWLLWTIVGVVAFAGTILIIQYGVDSSDDMAISVERRTP